MPSLLNILFFGLLRDQAGRKGSGFGERGCTGMVMLKNTGKRRAPGRVGSLQMRNCSWTSLQGNWDMGKAFRLKWTDGHVWCQTCEVPIDEEVEFKTRRSNRYVLVLHRVKVAWYSSRKKHSGSLEGSIAYVLEEKKLFLLVLSSILDAHSVRPQGSFSCVAPTTACFLPHLVNFVQIVELKEDDGTMTWEGGENRSFKVGWANLKDFFLQLPGAPTSMTLA
eukprot:833126-Pelagomonas_calceolata.AAC.10